MNISYSYQIQNRKWLFAKIIFILLFAFNTHTSRAQTIAAWDFTGENTVATSTAEVYSSSLDASNVLTRGAGAAASAGANSFRTVGFQNNGIAVTNTDYFQITLSATPGNVLSLSTIDARFAGTATFANSPGVTFQFAYSLDGTTFTLIGSPVQVVGTPQTMTQINLSGVSALQNVAAGVTVSMRYYASGQTTTGGWGFTSPSAGAYGLAIGGSVNASGSIATLSNITQPSGVILQGSNNVVLAGFTLSSTASADFTAATVSSSGTATSTDIDAVRIFLDNNANGLIDGADASVSGAGVAYSASMALTITGETGITTARNYLIVANVLGTATPGNAVQVSIASGAFTTTATTNVGSATGVSRTISAPGPVITITGTLSAFTTVEGTPSASQSYSVSGVSIVDSIVIVPPSPFEISLDNSTWITSSGHIALIQSGGNVTSTLIHVRFNPTAAGPSSGNIAHTSTSATLQNQPVSGTATASPGPLLYAVTSSVSQQNFNGLPSTGGPFTTTGSGPLYLGVAPVNASNTTGWQYAKITGSNDVVLTVSDGSSTSGSIFSYGSGSNSERALGTVASGNFTGAIGVVIKNTTADVLSSVTVSFTGEQWRNGGGGLPNNLTFSYSLNATSILTGTYTAVPSLNFGSLVTGSPAATLNGNNSPNNAPVSATFTLNANWLPNQLLVLKWEDFKEGGSNDGLAIDDFSFSASPPPAPTLQDSTLSFTSISTLSLTANWINGNAVNHLVKINTVNSFTNPVDFTGYTANPVYSGSGEQVVYAGTGSSVNVSNLTPGTNYFFRVYGYNGTGAGSKYITATATLNPNSVTTATPSAATQLAILSVNGGVNPAVNQPFSVVVQSQDGSGNPQTVGSNTTVDLSVFNGIGSISGGNVTGVITAGTNSVTITGVKYDTPDFGVQLDAAASAGDPLTSGQSPLFDVDDVASTLIFQTTPSSGVVNTVVSSIVVKGIRMDLTTDPAYTGSVTLAVATGPGTISGTLTVAAVAGQATFNDIQFSAQGSYTIIATATGLTSTTSSTITITNPPTLTELVIPQFVGGKTSTSANTDRTPFAICIQIDNLVPGVSYDLKTGIEEASVATGYGGGIIWTGASFTGTTITNAFTANGSGSSGPYWVFVQPGPSRFEPGITHNIRIGFVANGGGSIPTNPNFIGSKLITALDATTTARTPATTDDGAFIKGNSVPCISGKFVLFYSNEAGTGDPLFSYQARQMTATNPAQSGLPSSVDAIYSQGGSSVVGDFVGVIPTGANNPSGVRRVEVRNYDNTILNATTDADGVWPSGANSTTIARHAVVTLTSSDTPLNTVSVTTTSTPASCTGSNNGTATANATGVGTITYSWNTSPVQTTMTATNLAAGNYTVTVSDANGCTATSTTTVGQPAASTITPSGPTTFCNGGSVTLSAGTGVSYLWSPNGETTQSIVVTTAGTYTVTVDDGAGCVQASAPVTVVVNSFEYAGTIYSENFGTTGGGGISVLTYTGYQNSSPITYSSTTPTKTDIRQTGTLSSGYTGSSGGSHIFMGGSAAAPARDLIISGINTLGGTNFVLSFGLIRTAGTITADSLTLEISTDGITYTNAVRYYATTGWVKYTPSIPIPATANLRLRFTKTSNSNQFRIDDIVLTSTITSVSVSPAGPINLCPGASVTLTSNVATGNVWSPGLETTNSIVVSATGNYYVTVTGTNGCTASSSAVVVQSVPAPSVTTSVTDITCSGAANGTATANVISGTSPYTYSWNSVPLQTGSTATGLSAGNYAVTVTDINGCTGTASAVIAEPLPVSVTVTQDSSIACYGGSTTVTVNATGGTPIYSGTGSFPVSQGTYTYTVTDANGCTGTNSITINQPAEIIITNVSPGTGCPGTDITITGSNLSGITSVSFNGSLVTPTITNANEIHAIVPVAATSGFITITDANGCSATSTTSFTVTTCGGAINMQITMFLQGYYIGGGMMTAALSNQGVAGATGAETDTVNVELRDASDPTLIVDSAEGILMTNGILNVSFNTAVAGTPYWIAVNHRNTLQTWSSSTIALSTSLPNSWNFTLDPSQTYGSNVIDVLNDDFYSMYTGDLNFDGFIDAVDFPPYDSDNLALVEGYAATDFTGDGFVDAVDFPVLDANNLNLIESLHP